MYVRDMGGDQGKEPGNHEATFRLFLGLSSLVSSSVSGTIFDREGEERRLRGRDGTGGGVAAGRALSIAVTIADTRVRLCDRVRTREGDAEGRASEASALLFGGRPLVRLVVEGAGGIESWVFCSGC